IPKAIALGAPERFALILSRPIDVLARLLGPVVGVLNGITRWVARSMGVEMNQDAAISAEELRLIVERGGEQGVLEAEEEQMINSIIELGERRLHEVMIPRIAIVALAASATLDEAIDKVVDEGHSRIPVYEESIDEVVGILYAKDLLPILKAGGGPSLGDVVAVGGLELTVETIDGRRVGKVLVVRKRRDEEGEPRLDEDGDR